MNFIPGERVKISKRFNHANKECTKSYEMEGVFVRYHKTKQRVAVEIRTKAEGIKVVTVPLGDVSSLTTEEK